MGDEPTPKPESQAPPAPANNTTSTPLPTGEPGKVFDEQYVKELRAEAAASRTAKKELEARLAEFEERDKSELEKAQGKTTKAERERDEAREALLRYQVAQEKEVPAKLVPLLTGKTREELEAQAALILENAKPADPDFDPGVREPAPAAQSPEEAHNAFFLEALKSARI